MRRSGAGRRRGRLSARREGPYWDRTDRPLWFAPDRLVLLPGRWSGNRRCRRVWTRKRRHRSSAVSTGRRFRRHSRQSCECRSVLAAGISFRQPATMCHIRNRCGAEGWAGQEDEVGAEASLRIVAVSMQEATIAVSSDAFSLQQASDVTSGHVLVCKRRAQGNRVDGSRLGSLTVGYSLHPVKGISAEVEYGADAPSVGADRDVALVVVREDVTPLSLRTDILSRVVQGSLLSH
jgi:hypothetical protein